MTARGQTGTLSAGLIVCGFVCAGLLLAPAPLFADVPRTSLLPRTPQLPADAIPRGETIPVLPELPPTSFGDNKKAGDKKPAVTATKSSDKKATTLQPRSRLEIIRYVSGEFAKVRMPLPASKEGFRYPAGQPLNEDVLRKVMTRGGSAANPGDNVQVTQIEFQDTTIKVDINGGAKPKRRWQDRIQVSAGGPMPTVTRSNSNATQGYQGAGSTLFLDFGRPLPDLTPDELKEFLAPFLDFRNQRSATENWVDTLPAEFQQAIKERRAMVGMDREMVIAAMGRPEKKIREKDDDGLETEDWIYGHPPGKTVFVKFAGEKVLAVREYPK